MLTHEPIHAERAALCLIAMIMMAISAFLFQTFKNPINGSWSEGLYNGLKKPLKIHKKNSDNR